jgi:LysM repeat protein
MKHVSRLTLVVAVVLMSVVAVFPAAAQGQLPATQRAVAYPVLGNHTVKAGESLFCIGRGYKISPWAIAQQNNIPWPYTIYPNRVLQIPDVQWYNIPAGPICATQFVPPPQPTVTPPPAATATPVPGPTATPSPVPQCRFYHYVHRGDTLYAIAWHYGSTVPAIAAANAIAYVNLIFAGTTLCIP